jgi:ATP-dependent helicase HrpB
VTLPIHAVLPQLIDALSRASNAVLIAPPGAGKTTAVAPALLEQHWCKGQILLLSPRRLAARAAAEFMAEAAGESVGQSIGYATRMDSRQSAATRILVVTQGIFRNQIQADPELSGVSAVLFDEVHERSLDSDFALALALDAQSGLRPDLRIIAMSATLDGTRFADMMNAPVVTSEGRSWPLTIRYLGRRAEARIEDDMASAVRMALNEDEGDILAFLPGVAEIERTAERLEGVAATLHRLHGSLDPEAQRKAIRPGPGRKVILATSIAETSLTIDGVRIVIDSGLARRPRYDRAAGMTRLVTERESQAAATQRAGRAARQGAGVAYRLWLEAATPGMPLFDPPEIAEADLSSLLLDCAIWGVADPQTLRWIDAPTPAALAEARRRLIDMGALDADARPTPHGRAVARLPVVPRLAHMMTHGQSALAAEIAVLLSERGLGGTDVDLERRHENWVRDRGKRADAARALARRWAGLAKGADGLRSPLDNIGVGVALAFPDRVARRRDATGEQWVSIGGRGFRLDPTHSLAKCEWLAVAETQGAGPVARILSAAEIDFADVEKIFASRITSGTMVRFDPASRAVRTETGKWLGAIRLSKGQDAQPSPDAVVAALIEGVRAHGLGMINWPASATSLRQRAAFARVTGLDDAALMDSLLLWFSPLMAGKRRLADIDAGALVQALRGLIGWDAVRQVDHLAPPEFISPAGTTHAIDYAAEAGPSVTLRVQALFGMSEHPCVGPDCIPLVLSLTSPGGKPIQTTRDLPGFWRGSWADVAKEMRGRYPRHNWPDDPSGAVASLKTKNALARQR